MSLLSSLLKLTQRPLSEEEKLQRILESAVAQRCELHVVFSQRLARPVPVRGRFAKIDGKKILLTLSTNAIADVWDNEPCSVYFSVRCQELSGSYAFKTIMQGHDSSDETTRAHIAMPTTYVERQVRRFERLSPSEGMVHRMAVWNLRPQLVHNIQAQTPVTVPLSRLAAMEEPSLQQMLPMALRDVGPADFIQMAQQRSTNHLVNVSAGGARLRLPNQEEMPEYEEGDNLLLLLALDSGRGSSPLMLTLAGSCCNVAKENEALDVKLRFTYWNRQHVLERMVWAPVTLNGVSPLYEWVAQGLGVSGKEAQPEPNQQMQDLWGITK